MCGQLSTVLNKGQGSNPIPEAGKPLQEHSTSSSSGEKQIRNR